jgi:signal transduction histidine kinase
MTDSLYNREKIRSIQNLNFNAQLQKQEEEAAKAQFQSRLRVYILLGLLSIFLLIGIMLLRNNNQRKKANALLQAQKAKVESTLRELKATQAQLIQSEKMASLGELTAGIAHEIQNPLNFVNNFSETNTELLEEMNQELVNGNIEEAKHIAVNAKENNAKINLHGRRADSIVKSMLEHSRMSKGEKQPTDINALCDEYLRLAYHGFRAKDKNFNAKIETHFDDNIGKIDVVPQDIGRALLNLYNNAFWVVAEKKMQLGDSYEPTVMVSTKGLNKKVEIAVADNGTGIPQKAIDKVFQPFFTTKPTGQGTGLGLSLSYDIVKAHGGELKVESSEDEGAIFIITLPL